MSNNTGGPAFPCAEIRNMNEEIVQYASEGMTLRDYFAAKAMSAYIASMTEGQEPIEHATGISEHSYLFADAMLKAREA
jgi:hypothetical protein